MFCEKCGELLLGEKCPCQLFNIIDHEGDEYDIYALTKCDAAEKFARKSNEDGDYYLMNDSVDITVNGTVFSISAEPDVYYSAKEIK